MATEITFGGRQIKEPGAYSIIRSGVTNPPLSLSFGNVLIIDTGQGADFGGGSGVDGELEQNKKSIYSFSRANDFRDFVGGGLFWMLAPALFRPAGSGVNGVSNLFYIRAATTTSATMTFSPTGGGANGGTMEIKALNEGTVANGSEDGGSILRKGYAFRLVAGVQDPAKFILKFYKGTFKGLDSEGDAYDFIPEGESQPVLVSESIEFATMEELQAWALQSNTFNTHFTVSAFSSAGDGSLDAADITAFAGNNLAAGGTETFDASGLEAALTAVQDLDYSIVMAPDSGTDAQSADNGAILAHLETEARYNKMMVVGSRDTEVNFSDSLADAQFYDSEKVVVVHGAVNVNAPTPNGLKRRNAFYKAALVTARLAGLEPQIPGTFKNLSYHSEVHDLTEVQRSAALDSGLLVTRYDSELNQNIIVQAINSLQNNSYIVNQDGTSYEITIERIKAQINKELVVNAKRQLLGNPAGANRGTLSEETIINFVSTYLDRRTATETIDNLIISYEDVNVQVQGDAYNVTYRFEPNFPVNKLLFTGFIIDPAS